MRKGEFPEVCNVGDRIRYLRPSCSQAAIGDRNFKVSVDWRAVSAKQSLLQKSAEVHAHTHTLACCNAIPRGAHGGQCTRLGHELMFTRLAGCTQSHCVSSTAYDCTINTSDTLTLANTATSQELPVEYSEFFFFLNVRHTHARWNRATLLKRCCLTFLPF